MGPPALNRLMSMQRDRRRRPTQGRSKPQPVPSAISLYAVLFSFFFPDESVTCATVSRTELGGRSVQYTWGGAATFCKCTYGYLFFRGRLTEYLFLVLKQLWFFLSGGSRGEVNGDKLGVWLCL